MQNNIKLILFCLTVNLHFINANQGNATISFIQAKVADGFRPLKIEFLETLRNIFKASTFVETGTFLGYTALNAAQVFENVHTIELSPTLYSAALETLKNTPNVKAHLGDSGETLYGLVNSLQGRVIFWLDGHYSGPAYYGQQTALGKVNTPIIDELCAILDSSLVDPVILIDDIRLFDKSIAFNITNEDFQLVVGNYPTIQEICALIVQKRPKYRCLIIDDVLFAYSKDINVMPSAIVEACTMSRTYEDTTFNRKRVLEAERVISKAQGLEKQCLENLFNLWCPIYHPIIKTRIGSHYILWKALLECNSGNSKKAYELIKKLKEIGWDDWRVFWYLSYFKNIVDSVNLHKPVITDIVLNNWELCYEMQHVMGVVEGM